jgi:predicted dehydrogenase
MKKIRWGLLSTADINGSIIPAIRASARGELTTISSRDGARAQAYAAKWAIPQALQSYDEMLASDLLDVVYISLPNHLHAEWTVKALEHGKHVLCEKPLALTVGEVDRMIKASRESELLLAEAFMYRHHPQTKIAGEWAQSGRLGEVGLVRCVFNFAVRNPKDIRLVAEFGGGSLWDLGVYGVSFAQFIIGSSPSSVAAHHWVGDSGVDEVFIGDMRYPNGALAQIASSLRTPSYSFAEILGTGGRLELNQPFVDRDENRRMTFYPTEGDPIEIDVPEKELYVGEIEDMNAAIIDGTPNYVTLLESRDHIRTVQALYRAAEDGTVIQLD